MAPLRALSVLLFISEFETYHACMGPFTMTVHCWITPEKVCSDEKEIAIHEENEALLSIIIYAMCFSVAASQVNCFCLTTFSYSRKVKVFSSVLFCRHSYI